MGVTCSVTIIGVNAPVIASRCLDLVDELERLWSRFIPSSDICRINHSAGRPTRIDPRTTSLVRHMVAGCEATHGCFNPCLLPLQLHLGDSSSLIDGRTSSVPEWTRVPTSVVDEVRGIEFLEEGLVRLPPGLTLDAGGLGKGRAADLIVAEALTLGADAACVNLGGDMSISGPTPDGNGWTVEILDPIDLRTPIATVVVNRGGVATSSMTARRRDGRGVAGHILSGDEPDTTSGSRGATVLASTATWAEMWTKFAVLTRVDRALDTLESIGLAAMIVTHDGSLVTTSTWKAFTP